MESRALVAMSLTVALLSGLLPRTCRSQDAETNREFLIEFSLKFMAARAEAVTLRDNLLKNPTRANLDRYNDLVRAIKRMEALLPKIARANVDAGNANSLLSQCQQAITETYIEPISSYFIASHDELFGPNWQSINTMYALVRKKQAELIKRKNELFKTPERKGQIAKLESDINELKQVYESLRVMTRLEQKSFPESTFFWTRDNPMARRFLAMIENFDFVGYTTNFFFANPKRLFDLVKPFFYTYIGDSYDQLTPRIADSIVLPALTAGPGDMRTALENSADSTIVGVSSEEASKYILNAAEKTKRATIKAATENQDFIFQDSLKTALKEVPVEDLPKIPSNLMADAAEAELRARVFANKKLARDVTTSLEKKRDRIIRQVTNSAAENADDSWKTLVGKGLGHANVAGYVVDFGQDFIFFFCTLPDVKKSLASANELARGIRKKHQKMVSEGKIDALEMPEDDCLNMTWFKEGSCFSESGNDVNPTSIWTLPVRHTTEADGRHGVLPFDIRVPSAVGTIGGGRPVRGQLIVRAKGALKARQVIRSSEGNVLFDGALGGTWNVDVAQLRGAHLLLDLSAYDSIAFKDPVRVRVDIEYKDAPAQPTARTPVAGPSYGEAKQSVEILVNPLPAWVGAIKAAESEGPRRPIPRPPPSLAPPPPPTAPSTPSSSSPDGARKATFHYGPIPADWMAMTHDGTYRKDAMKVIAAQGDLPISLKTFLYIKRQRERMSQDPRGALTYRAIVDVHFVEGEPCSQTLDEFRARVRRIAALGPQHAAPWDCAQLDSRVHSTFMLSSSPSSRGVTQGKAYTEDRMIVLDPRRRFGAFIQVEIEVQGDDEGARRQMLKDLIDQVHQIIDSLRFGDGKTVTLIIHPPIRWLGVGEPREFRAILRGGDVPPEAATFEWSGMATNTGNSIKIRSDQPGKYTLKVIAKGPDGPTAEAIAILSVVRLASRITLEGPIYVGVEVPLESTLAGPDSKEDGNLIYRWEPHPEVRFQPHDGTAASRSIAIFRRPGPVNVWTVLLERCGEEIVTVAESDAIAIDVQSPVLRIQVDPTPFYVAAEVPATILTEPVVVPGYIDFRWVPWPGNLQLLGESQDTSAVRFLSRDTRPTSLVARARTIHFGDDLGQGEVRLQAIPYEVKVLYKGPMGPAPQNWQMKEGGFAPAAHTVVPFQNVRLSATIDPPPPGTIRYEWNLNADSHFAGNSLTRDVTVNRSQVGSCTATVIVRNADGIELGRGSGRFEVQASPEAPGRMDEN